MLRGHLGQTFEEAEITGQCTIILMDVVYSMMTKCWRVCPFYAVSGNVDKCMNSCVLKNAKRKGPKYASEEDIRSYIKQCPSITLNVKNTFLRAREVITAGGRFPDLEYWRKQPIYYVEVTRVLVQAMQLTCI